MELTELRSFVAVAEAGSVNRAAVALRLSQPAVTRHVQRLESALGVALLDRRAKPVKLTAAGLVALKHCRAIIAAVEALAAVVKPGAGPSGDCRIGVSPSLADFALPAALDRLRQRFPRLSIQIVSGWSRGLVEQLRSGMLDTAIVQLPDGERLPGDVSGRQIGKQPLVFVAPRRARVAAALPLEQLGTADWVLNPDGCGFRAKLRQELQRVGAPLRVAIEAYGHEAQLALIARGLGFGLVPARTLARYPERAKLQTFRVKGQDLRVTVWSVRGRPREAIRPVLDALDADLLEALPAASKRSR